MKHKVLFNLSPAVEPEKPKVAPTKPETEPAKPATEPPFTPGPADPERRTEPGKTPRVLPGC